MVEMLKCNWIQTIGNETKITWRFSRWLISKQQSIYSGNWCELRKCQSTSELIFKSCSQIKQIVQCAFCTADTYEMSFERFKVDCLSGWLISLNLLIHSLSMYYICMNVYMYRIKDCFVFVGILCKNVAPNFESDFIGWSAAHVLDMVALIKYR